MESPNVSVSGKKVSEKEDGTISIISDSEEDRTIRQRISFRERLRRLFHHHRFQVAIVALVLIDTLIVFAELIIEAKEHEIQNHTIPHALHAASIGILCVFLIEIAFKIYAFGLDFFRHKLEIFDAIVVILSFALDIAFWDTEGIDLIIILRLWRVARILNGVVVSVQAQSEHKLEKEKRKRLAVEEEMRKCRAYITALEREIHTLRELLIKNNIPECPPTSVHSPPREQLTIRAEVNPMPKH